MVDQIRVELVASVVSSAPPAAGNPGSARRVLLGVAGSPGLAAGATGSRREPAGRRAGLRFPGADLVELSCEDDVPPSVAASSRRADADPFAADEGPRNGSGYRVPGDVCGRGSSWQASEGGRSGKHRRVSAAGLLAPAARLQLWRLARLLHPKAPDRLRRPEARWSDGEFANLALGADAFKRPRLLQSLELARRRRLDNDSPRCRSLSQRLRRYPLASNCA